MRQGHKIISQDAQDQARHPTLKDTVREKKKKPEVQNL